SPTLTAKARQMLTGHRGRGEPSQDVPPKAPNRYLEAGSLRRVSSPVKAGLTPTRPVVRAQDLDQAAEALCRSNGNDAELVGRSTSPGRAHAFCVKCALY